MWGGCDGSVWEPYRSWAEVQPSRAAAWVDHGSMSTEGSFMGG